MDCECSEEYGPCVDHSTVLVQRDGAAVRTADELAREFLDDCASIITAGVDPVHAASLAALLERLPAPDGWCDDADDAQELHDACTMVETWLPAGIVVTWDDGYTIARMSDDCPLGDDTTCGECGHAWSSLLEPTPASRCPREYDHIDRDAVTASYVACALWSSVDDDDAPMDDEYDAADIDAGSLEDMRADVDAFIVANYADIVAAISSGPDYSAAMVGHDLWLTRDGHGAGFWDRGLGDIGDRLSAAARVYGESNLYVGDDGRVYVG